MADRFPLIANSSSNQIQELASGDNLDLTGSGIHNAGIITATTFSGALDGTASGLTGTPDISVRNISGVAATFTGAVSIGGTLTYEDVTNVDSVGIVTARQNIVLGGDVIHLSDTDTSFGFPTTDQVRVSTAGSERARIDASGRVLIGTQSQVNGVFKLQVVGRQTDGGDASTRRGILMRYGSADTNSAPLRFEKSRGATGGTDDVVSGDDLGQLLFSGTDGGDYRLAAVIDVECDGTPASNVVPGRINFSTTPLGGGSTQRLRIDSVGNFIFNNSALIEHVEINTTARTGTQNVDLLDGMVHNFTTASAGTWTPNFRIGSTTSLNSVMSIGEAVSPTLIVAKGATTHFSNSIQIDGSAVTPEFLGGAPTAGGGAGTFDIYSYTIIKTADATFTAFCSVSTFE